MRFTSLHFFAFFAVVLLGLKLLRRREAKIDWLLLAGIFFYGYFDWRFLALIGFTSVFDFYMGIAIGQAKPPLRKRLLALDIAVNLGILVVFKYLNFFAQSLHDLLSPLGWQVGTLNIILPIGISFFVFEAMSYCIDIYRGDLEPYRNWRHFALFIFFFPRMIAGPIIRPGDFLPQLQREIHITTPNLILGGQMFLLGLSKKLVVADRLSSFVDLVFNNPSAYSAATLWQALIAYSIQIFCDFSGYSDMALGAAKMMGFDLPANFRMPYVSISLTEFWRRWHISLSSWLRDYLYIPLGGNRRGVARMYLNLFVTMALGGLWHGASWHFLTWGVLHGIGLIVHKLWMNGRARIGLWGRPNIVLTALSWLLTYAWVCLAWVFFRAQTFADALLFLRRMIGDWQSGIAWVNQWLWLLLPFVILAHAAGVAWEKSGRAPILQLQKFGHLAFVCFWALGIFFLSATVSAPFIYFQF